MRQSENNKMQKQKLNKTLDGKEKVTALVEDYKNLFPEEFKNFMKGQREKTPLNKFATMKGSEVVERQLGEMPETLYFMFQQHLTTDELNWFNSKPGYTWFYNTFTEFKITGGRV